MSYPGPTPVTTSPTIDAMMQAATPAAALAAIGAIGPSASPTDILSGTSNVLGITPSGLKSFNAFSKAIYPANIVVQQARAANIISGPISQTFTSRTSFKLATAVTQLQIVYPLGFIFLDTSEILTPNPISINSSIEIAGTCYPITFSGRKVATCDPAGHLVSDPLAVNLTAGVVIAIRTYCSNTGSFRYPQSSNAGVIGASGDGYTLASDVTTGGAMADGDSSGIFIPIVCGTPKISSPLKSVLFIGDSLSTGYDSIWPWWQYGLHSGTGVSGVVVACIGARVASHLDDHYWPCLINGNTHAFLLMGTNDIMHYTLEETQGYLTSMVAQLHTRGLKVYQGTLPPRTASTDGWVTTGNQMVESTESKRTALNDWIRVLGSGADACVDTADSVESARNSGLWKPSKTTDGIHWSNAGCQLAGALLVNGTIFT